MGDGDGRIIDVCRAVRCAQKSKPIVAVVVNVADMMRNRSTTAVSPAVPSVFHLVASKSVFLVRIVVVFLPVVRCLTPWAAMYEVVAPWPAR
eukprot:3768883-Pyramimonas_sp.AAC.4